MIREYLKAAYEDGNSQLLITAIGNVAKAQGMTEIARKTNLSRQNLYKALSPNATPKIWYCQKGRGSPRLQVGDCLSHHPASKGSQEEPHENHRDIAFYGYLATANLNFYAGIQTWYWS